jgi:prepilin-type processing-associated H-X9-DG protein
MNQLNSHTFQGNRGFAEVDLIVLLIGAIAIAGVVLVGVAKHRASSSRYTCSYTLKQISLAEYAFRDTHNGCVPWTLSTNRGGSFEYNTRGDQAYRHFQVQSNELLTCRLLICPQDKRLPATDFWSLRNANISYFTGLDSTPAIPLSIVAGDRNITLLSSVIVETTRSGAVGWIKSVGLHRDKGNLVFGDGHVEEVDSTGLSNAISRTDITKSRFAVP